MLAVELVSTSPEVIPTQRAFPQNNAERSQFFSRGYLALRQAVLSLPSRGSTTFKHPPRGKGSQFNSLGKRASPGTDFRETAVSSLEKRFQFPAQELNLGSLDENQESQLPVHQWLEARSKIPLALAPFEKLVSQRGKNSKTSTKFITRDAA